MTTIALPDDTGPSSLLRPSAAHRWLPCPAAVRMERDRPDDSSAEAREGTAIHYCAERMLANLWDPAYRDEPLTVRVPYAVDGDTHWDDIVLDADMVGVAREYADYVRRQSEDRLLWVELPLDLSAVLGVPRTGGTVDAVILDKHEQSMQIIDLKTGRRAVAATGNAQLRLYAAAALVLMPLVAEVQTVQLTIVQPRLGQLAHETLTVDELHEWAASAAQTARLAEAIWHGAEPADRHRQAGEHCTYCRARAVCPSVADWVMGYTDTAPAERTPDELVQQWHGLTAVESWVAAVRAEVRALAERDAAPGLKLVRGRRGARRWSDTGEAKKRLLAAGVTQDAMYTPVSLRSPTQLQQRVSAEHYELVSDCIVQPDGAPQVAALDDPRPAVAPAVDDFAEIAND